jgi:CBS-domain-containing membrane protein
MRRRQYKPLTRDQEAQLSGRPVTVAVIKVAWGISTLALVGMVVTIAGAWLSFILGDRQLAVQLMLASIGASAVCAAACYTFVTTKGNALKNT